MKRVLIVDDNRMLANLYRSTIVAAGFGVEVDPTLGSVRVIVFSNSFTPERTEQLWQAGVTQLLIKASSSPRVVLDAIRTAIGDTGG